MRRSERARPNRFELELQRIFSFILLSALGRDGINNVGDYQRTFSSCRLPVGHGLGCGAVRPANDVTGGTGDESGRAFSRAAVLAVSVSLMLLVTLRAFAADPAGGINVPILVTQVPPRGQDAAAERADCEVMALPGEGGRILLINPDGTQRVVTQGFHSAADPAVSFDGKSVVFAGKQTAESCWNVYELTLATGQLRQVTQGAGNCRQPGYQSNLFTVDSPEPWFQLTFVSDASGWMNEAGGGPVRSLYSCRLDGTQVRRLSYNLSDDLDPFLMGDGRIVYASWQRATLERGPLGRMALFAINIEGTDNALFAEPAGKRFKRTPCVTDRGLVLFVESDEITVDGYGQVGSVTFRRPLNSYRPITQERGGFAYFAPAPWTHGRVLIARRPVDRSASSGLYLFDPQSATSELVLDDPAWDEVQAVAIQPTRRPDGRSTVVDDTEPLAKLYCLNISTHNLPDLNWWPPGIVKRVRLLEGIPLTVAERDMYLAESVPGAVKGATRNGLPPIVQRRLVGETDVFPDGSFHLSIPANLPIELQALDEDGMALRSCRWIWSKNLEPRGCIGCHEDGEATPENAMADALRRPAVELTLPPERRRTVDFRRDVMPIVDQKCVVCHGPDGAPPRLDGGLAPVPPDGLFNRAYVSLLTPAGASQADSGRGAYVNAGQARTSPLIWHLFGRNTARPWDGEAITGQPAKAIPAGTITPLTNREIRTFVEWVDFGAMWDGIPGPDAGTADPSPADQAR